MARASNGSGKEVVRISDAWLRLLGLLVLVCLGYVWFGCLLACQAGCLVGERECLAGLSEVR